MKIKQTDSKEYCDRLYSLENITLKKILNVQLPYRYNLRILKLGFVLEIGCGIGRNLINLKGNAVGIDHNPYAVELACRRGLTAYTNEEFKKSEYNIQERFDSILMSHLIEHMVMEEVYDLLNEFKNNLKRNGKLVMITPQEKGYNSDATHVEFIDWKKHQILCKRLNFIVTKQYSYPFPRVFGKLFTYNEFITVAIKT